MDENQALVLFDLLDLFEGAPVRIVDQDGGTGRIKLEFLDTGNSCWFTYDTAAKVIGALQ